MIEYNEIANALVFPRGAGRTTAMAKAAKDHSFTLLTHSHQEAQRLKREFNIDAMAYNSAVRLRGTQKVAIMDHHAVYCLIQEMDAEIQKWREEATLKQQVINKIKALLP